MAYTFQTFTTSQVLTSTQMNQVEANIQEHIHGAGGVTGNYTSMTGTTVINYRSYIKNRIKTGLTSDITDPYTAGRMQFFNIHEHSVNSAYPEARHVILNPSSGGSMAISLAPTSLTTGITYSTYAGGNLSSAAKLELGWQSFINSISDISIYGVVDSAASYSYAVSNDPLLIWASYNQFINFDSYNTRTYLNVFKVATNSNYSFTQVKSYDGLAVIAPKLFEFGYKSPLGGGSYTELRTYRTNPLGAYADYGMTGSIGFTIVNTRYSDATQFPIYIYTSSMGVYSQYKSLQIGETFEVAWSVSGRLTSGASDVYISITASYGNGVDAGCISPLTDYYLSRSTKVTSSSVIVGRTTLSSGQAFQSTGTMLVKVNSSVGPYVPLALVIKVSSGTLSSSVNSGDYCGLYVNY